MLCVSLFSMMTYWFVANFFKTLMEMSSAKYVQTIEEPQILNEVSVVTDTAF